MFHIDSPGKEQRVRHRLVPWRPSLLDCAVDLLQLGDRAKYKEIPGVSVQRRQQVLAVGLQPRGVAGTNYFGPIRLAISARPTATKSKSPRSIISSKRSIEAGSLVAPSPSLSCETKS